MLDRLARVADSIEQVIHTETPQWRQVSPPVLLQPGPTKGREDSAWYLAFPVSA